MRKYFTKKWQKRLSYLVVIFLIVSSFLFLLNQLKVAVPTNPLTKQVVASQAMLDLSTTDGTKPIDTIKGEGKEQQKIPEDKQSTKRPNSEESSENQEKNEEVAVKGEDKGNLDNKEETSSSSNEETAQNTVTNKNKETKNKEQTASKTNTQEKEESPEVKPTEIVAGKKDTNPYFTTTIIDGETVSKESYQFSIIQKSTAHKLLALTVSVNDEIIDDFANQVNLVEGKNNITISATYDDDKKTVVSRQYTVYFAKNQVVISASIKDGLSTTVAQLSFNADAYYNEELITLAASMDDAELVKNGEGSYAVQLNEGLNTIVLKASKGTSKKQLKLRIYYEKKKSSIEFTTDLTNANVQTADLVFYAEAKAGEENIPVTATINGERIKNKSNWFSDLLQEGKNTIQIAAKTADDSNEENYVIYYTAPADDQNSTTLPNDADGPEIVTDLVNNTQIKGTQKNIIIKATDSTGTRIQASGLQVMSNNKAMSVIWDDSEKTSYRLQLEEGKNTIVIKAWDTQGRITTKSYTIYSKNSDAGDSVGHATISVEADSVGLGYILPPSQIELFEGVNAAYLLDQYLKDNGFTYTSTGSLNANFYLSSIMKKGMSNKLSISTKLDEEIKKSTLVYDPTNYSNDALGEFDITSGSGWMYSVNGDYPNYGFSDGVILDGDVVRIQFTIMYGKELGAFFPGGQQ